MIPRDLTKKLRAVARSFPAVTLTGPRQSGKSTLCRDVFKQLSYANLEAPDVRSFAQDDPRGFLAQYAKGAIIDEVQRCPELPSYIQGLIDQDPKPGRWVLTGSQNLALLESVNQSLAGRTAVLHLLPLNYAEICRFEQHPTSLDATLLFGGYPRIFDQHLHPADWLSAYVSTYIERDVRTIMNIGDLTTFQKFVEFCAGRTSQLLNFSSLATDAGISQPTAKAWVSVLETSFVVHKLPSYSGNIRKRLAKMPKLHFHDSGLACWLMGIRDTEQLRTHPLRGSVFESWAVSEIIKHRTNRGEHGGVYFYRDQHGVEADLVIDNGNRLTIVEIKAGQTISNDMIQSTRRIKETLESAKEVDAFVIYGGDAKQTRGDLTLLPWKQIGEHEW